MKRIALFLALITPLTSWAKSTRTLKVDTLESSYASAMDIVNGDFERGTTGWAVSTTTPTTPGASTVTTFASVARGSQSVRWDSDGAGRYFESSPLQLRAGLYGKNGVASCQFKCASGTCTHTVGAFDNAGNSLGTTTIQSSTTFSRSSVNFVYPSSGSVKLRVTAVAANEPELIIDDCALGDAAGINLSQVNQASFYGGLEWVPAASCTWSVTALSSFSDFSADTDCSTPVAYGNASAPSTKVPQIVFNNMPPGDYLFIQSGYNYGNSSTTGCAYQFSDGTNSFGFGGNGIATANIVGAHVMGWISYTTAGNRTIKMQATGVGGSQPCYISAATGSAEKMMISAYRFPSASEMAYRPDQTPWYVNSYILDTNGATTITTGSATDQEMADTDYTMTPVSGSAPVGVVCSSTNASTTASTTCSAGSEVIGGRFVIPKTGTYEACVQFADYVGTVGNEAIVNAFQLNEVTPDTATIIQRGLGTHTVRNRTIPADGTLQITSIYPITLCSSFTFSSVGEKAIKLFYAKDSTFSSGSNNLSNAQNTTAAAGTSLITFRVRPMSQNQPVPLLVGSVNSNSSGVERIERLRGGSGGSITSQSGSWITGVSKTGTGVYAYTVASGIFSASPTCTCLIESAGGESVCNLSGLSSTGFTLNTWLNSGAAADTNHSVLCMGPR